MRKKIGRAGGVVLFAWLAGSAAAATTTVTVDPKG